MFCYLNLKVLPDLERIYNKIKHLLPFKIELPLPLLTEKKINVKPNLKKNKKKNNWYCFKKPFTIIYKNG